MSIDYSLTVTLQAPFNRGTIEFFVERCIESGGVFQDEVQLSFLNSKQACDKILSHDYQGGDPNNCRIKFQDASILLCFVPSEDRSETTIIFILLSACWYKRSYEQDTYFSIDFGRFGNLLLSIFRDFKLKKFYAEIDY